jgi:hypothetical protein
MIMISPLKLRCGDYVQGLHVLPAANILPEPIALGGWIKGEPHLWTLHGSWREDGEVHALDIIDSGWLGILPLVEAEARAERLKANQAREGRAGEGSPRHP